MSAEPGDDQPLLDLFREHHQRMVNYAFRLTADRDEAEDVAAHVFLALAEEHRRGHVPRQPLAWLYRCASNRIVSIRRRAMVRDMARGDVWSWFTRRVEAPHPIHAEDEAHAVRHGLSRLKHEDRQVIVLRYDEELEFADIARIMGVEQSSVRSRLSRALARLRKALGVAEGGANQ